MTRKIKFKRGVVIIFWSFIALLTFLFVESQFQNRKLGNIQIKILNQEDNYFLDTLEIKRLLTLNGKDELQGKTFRSLSIKNLEARVKSNLYVDKCEIARNLRGDLLVEVTQARPIARFSRKGKPDFYVDSLGKILPVLSKFTARVILVTREDTEQLPNFAGLDRNLLKLLNLIYHDKFFKSQITQIDILKTNALVLYPQVGNHKIEFGACTFLEEKIKRLKIFYKEIIPLKGWNIYKKVNLRFDNQIVCE
jgi:cell division protein FtsQ